jgi:hypothetical protein
VNRVFSWLLSLAAVPFELIDRAQEVWGEGEDE